MFHKKNAATLFGLCAALAACEGVPSRELMAPEDPGGGTPDAQSVSLLAPSNTWVATRSMPRARDSHRAGTLNDIIYVVGGRDSNEVPLSSVHAYDVATNTWSVRQSLPRARWDLNGVSVIAGRLYVTGGHNSTGLLTKTLYVYNPGQNLWVQKADMPEVGACGAQGVISGLLYVYVGCSATGIGRLFRYNPAINTWMTLAPPPTDEHFYGVGGVIGGKFYLAGGGFDLDKLEVYNPATNTWRSRTPMPSPAIDMAGAVLDGKLFVAGGRGLNSTILATLRVYSPATNKWTIKAPMPAPRYATAGAAAGGLFFVLGGIENGAATRKVRAYTP